MTALVTIKLGLLGGLATISKLFYCCKQLWITDVEGQKLNIVGTPSRVPGYDIGIGRGCVELTFSFPMKQLLQGSDIAVKNSHGDESCFMLTKNETLLGHTKPEI